jgi:hypothetical protein
VCPERLDELVAHAEKGIEAGERVLRDEADLLASQWTHCLGVVEVHLPPGHAQTTGGDPHRRRDQSDEGRGGERLSSPGFADETEHPTRLDPE